MSKSRALVCLAVVTLGFSLFSHAVVADRITAPLSGGPMVAVKGNVHGMVKPENDLGRADTSRLIQGISLALRPSAAQQQDLDNFLKQLADPTSPNYHKYLTPKQFGARFGMSQNDLDKITEWLQSQGFSNFKISNSRNYISFDGTVGQIESVFKIEMHNYLVNGVVHLANAQNPSVPAALSGIVISVGHLHDFAPRPRAKVKSNFTSYVSGNHFLTPGDFATIYDITPLYNAGIDGTGQKIAVVGQSTVSTTDLANFRSRAGLPASTVTMILQGGTATKCAGDEGESDLDLEWSGGVAKGAQIIFVYAGLKTGDSCTGNRSNSVWDALQYAVDNKVAPFISTSYGYCESGLGSANLTTFQGWAQQAVSQGQTITSASGDAGAADCESGASKSATTGYAVDAPASIPEVTGAGGNEFTGDSAGAVTGTAPNTTAGATPYWSASGTGSDAISTALSYIPETAWNDTTADIAAGGGLSASGGGASIQFSKPAWQTGTGVPNDGKRDVPDVSVSASADHDGYLVCSEDSSATSCSSGFRESAGGNLDVVGGTSAAAPTISAIFALINQYLGNTPPTGLAPINATLYTLPGNSPSPFHDVTSGNNIVPCTQNTPDCPASAPLQFGFKAGAGYDQVTGLGSIDAYNFAEIMQRTPTALTVTPSVSNVNLGTSVTFTATVSPSSASGTVNFYNNGSTTAFGSGTLSSGTATYTSTNLPLGVNNVTASYAGDSNTRASISATPAAVTTTTSFSVAAQPVVTAMSVVQGQTTNAVNMAVTSTAGFVATTGTSSQTLLPVSYSCTGLPSEANCLFTPGSPSNATSVTLTITTTAPTARLREPFDRGTRMFYALLLPGLLGMTLTLGFRKQAFSRVRILVLIALLCASALWMASCGGSSGSGNKNPGTPTGTYTITVNAQASGNGITVSASPTPSFKLTVSP